MKIKSKYKRKKKLDLIDLQKSIDETVKKLKPTRDQAVEAVRTIIKYIGEDINRQGIIDTPERVIRAWEQDWGRGYSKLYIQEQVNSILKGKFEDGAENCDEMICVKDIPYFSNCMHHMSLFSGSASVAYIPNGKILGLSKIARVVEMFSKRLQVQESLTNQIADFINIHLKPLGVGVILTGTHSCMETRGIRVRAETVTSALRGEFLTDPSVRDEFLRLTGR